MVVDMRSHTEHRHGAERYLIELKLRDVSQLFNSMDPSPFQEKDLDQDAEDFIVSWAREYPRNAPLTLRVHLTEKPSGGDPKPLIEQAIHHFFAYKAELNRLEFSQLMKEGRLSMLIGLVFLASCLGLAEVLSPFGNVLIRTLKEGLLIVGWVAMWRPLEIYLYRWWPVRRIGKIYEKMRHMNVEVRVPHESPGHA